MPVRGAPLSPEWLGTGGPVAQVLAVPRTRVVLGRRGVPVRLREVGMLRAVFVRTLKPGVRYEQFVDAWMPQDLDGEYSARVSVSRNVADDRQVITILELDMSMTEFEARRATLTRPDALERLGEIVATTELAGTYEEVFNGKTV